MLDSLENKLGEKITSQQELEADITENQFCLEYTKYEINNLKDAIITEYQKTIQEKLQEIEKLKEAKK